jgi:hypothetical protein
MLHCLSKTVLENSIVKTSRLVIMFVAVLVTVLFALVFDHEDIGAKEAQSIEGAAP